MPHFQYLSACVRRSIHVKRLTDYTRNCNMFIIFHAWYQNTFVLYIPHAWRGIFQRDNFCEVSFCSGCDRRNSFEREMIIGI